MPREGVVLSVYVTANDAAMLRERATAADRSVSAELRRLLRPLHAIPFTSEGSAATPSPRDMSGVEGADHACSTG